MRLPTEGVSGWSAPAARLLTWDGAWISATDWDIVGTDVSGVTVKGVPAQGPTAGAVLPAAIGLGLVSRLSWQVA